MVLIFSTSS